MELSERELKDLENLLVKNNINKKKFNQNNKSKNLNNFRKNRLIISLPKLLKKSKKVDVKFKFPKISLNIPTNENKKLNNEKLEISVNNSLSENDNNKVNHINNKKKIFVKKERSLIVKNILEQISRKNNDNSPKSSNTNLKLYGELFPGPGQYDLNQNDIALSHNLRYKNLFINDSKKTKKFSEINIGPGTYNLIDNFKHISYAQNPKVFISSLERPSIINENEINKNVGPGTYEIHSPFDRNRNRGLEFLSHSIKQENKNEKIQKILLNELNRINNTNFFNLKNCHNKLEKVQNDFSKNKSDRDFIINEKIIGNDDIEFKNQRFNSIQNSKREINKRYLIDKKNKSKRKCITNENLVYNEKIFPSIKRKIINLIPN